MFCPYGSGHYQNRKGGESKNCRQKVQLFGGCSVARAAVLAQPPARRADEASWVCLMKTGTCARTHARTHKGGCRPGRFEPTSKHELAHS